MNYFQIETYTLEINFLDVTSAPFWNFKIGPH